MMPISVADVGAVAPVKPTEALDALPPATTSTFNPPLAESKTNGAAAPPEMTYVVPIYYPTYEMKGLIYCGG